MDSKERKKIWTGALETFRENLLALSAGKLAWASGLYEGRRFIALNFLKPNGAGKARLVRCAYGPTPNGGRRFSYVGHSDETSAAYEAAPGGFSTWCHMTAAIWSEAFAGIPLNVHRGAEVNANETFRLLAGGDFDRDGWTFRRVELADALALAEDWRPVFAAAPNLGRHKIGHIGVLAPNGTITQAGAETCEGITHRGAFGLAASEIPHFVLERAEGGEEGDEESDDDDEGEEA
jgi:hypothetical protein